MDSGRDLLKDLFEATVAGLENGAFTTATECTEHNMLQTKGATGTWSPLKRCCSMDSVFPSSNSNSTSSTPNTTAITSHTTTSPLSADLNIDLNRVSPEMPVYLLQGDEASDEEMLLHEGRTTLERRKTLNTGIAINDHTLSPTTITSAIRELPEPLMNDNEITSGIVSSSTQAVTGSPVIQVRVSPYSNPVERDLCCCVTGISEAETDVRSAVQSQKSSWSADVCHLPSQQSVQLPPPNDSNPLVLQELSPDLAVRLLGFDIQLGNSAAISSLLELMVSSAQTVNGGPPIPLVLGQDSVPITFPQTPDISSSTQSCGINCLRDVANSTVTLSYSGQSTDSDGNFSQSQLSRDFSVVPIGPNTSFLPKQTQQVKDLLRVHFMNGSADGESESVQQRERAFKRKANADSSGKGWTRGKKRKADIELLKPPKPPLTSFGVFRKESKRQFPKEEEMSVTEVSKKLGEQWSKLSIETKEEYRLRAEDDRKRFAADLKLHLQQKLQGVSILPVSLESLIMASFDPLDDKDCMYCHICKLSFFNVSNKQAHFCGRPHTVELIKLLEDIIKKHKDKEGSLSVSSLGLLKSRPTIKDMFTGEEERRKKAIAFANGAASQVQNKGGSNEESHREIDEHVRLILRKKLLKDLQHPFQSSRPQESVK